MKLTLKHAIPLATLLLQAPSAEAFFFDIFNSGQLNELQEKVDALQTTLNTMDEVPTKVDAMKTTLDDMGGLETKVDALQTTLNNMGTALQTMQSSIDDIGTALGDFSTPAPRMVPFAVESSGGLCNSVQEGSANPSILILSKIGIGGSWSTANDPLKEDFVVTSVIVRSASQSGGEGYTYLTVNSVTTISTEISTT